MVIQEGKERGGHEKKTEHQRVSHTCTQRGFLKKKKKCGQREEKTMKKRGALFPTPNLIQKEEEKRKKTIPDRAM